MERKCPLPDSTVAKAASRSSSASFCKSDSPASTAASNLGFEPDAFTFLAVLSACARVGALGHGEWVHRLMVEKGVITGDRSMTNGYTTFSSATFSVFGDGFIASGTTFRNTNGPGTQAVALLSGSDRSVFYRCGFEGYQDTLCVFSQRQFYKECDIYGTIDFIFGNTTVVLQNCNIYMRRSQLGESNVITAQGRLDANQNTGIVIQYCNIRSMPDLQAVAGTVKSYLGRPWQPYSRTVC